jgi:hypothetical protein
MSDFHLFCAEVDGIQSTLFRASGQRQVVGGSNLLAELDRCAPLLAQECYGVAPEDVIKHGGGSFLIVFPDRESAAAFGLDLADLYRIALDATITVTDPLPLPGGRNGPDFSEKQKRINQDLRRMKRENRGPVEVAQVPTTAYCQSSGTGQAEYFEKPSAILAEKMQYLSKYAKEAGEAGATVKKQDQFLGRLFAFLPEIYNQLQLAKTADDLAKLDEARGNVAYLLADANNMGKYFNACDAEQMKALADALDRAMCAAVTAPLEKLIERLGLDEQFLPLMPLILAGDDVFLMLPAFYALDYARTLCLKFEEFMTAEPVIKALRGAHNLPNPTLAACVVICKGGYPYHLAHQRGEELLGNAKRMTKNACAGQPVWKSAVTFDMIAGGELVSRQEGEKTCLATLTPYWVSQATDLKIPFRKSSIELSILLGSRYELRAMPQKRLVEIEHLYTPEMLPVKITDVQDSRWMKALQRLQDRMKASEEENKAGPTLWDTFQPVLSSLGDEQKSLNTFKTGHWRDISRPASKLQYANGVADLLRVWHYAQALTHRMSEYQKEEER